MFAISHPIVNQSSFELEELRSSTVISTVFCAAVTMMAFVFSPLSPWVTFAGWILAALTLMIPLVTFPGRWLYRWVKARLVDQDRIFKLGPYHQHYKNAVRAANKLEQSARIVEEPIPNEIGALIYGASVSLKELASLLDGLASKSGGHGSYFSYLSHGCDCIPCTQANDASFAVVNNLEAATKSVDALAKAKVKAALPSDFTLSNDSFKASIEEIDGMSAAYFKAYKELKGESAEDILNFNADTTFLKRLKNKMKLKQTA